MATTSDPKIKWAKVLTAEEGKQLVDRQTRRYFNMSADEFIAVWNTGVFDNDPRPEVAHVAMLIPFATP